MIYHQMAIAVFFFAIGGLLSATPSLHIYGGLCFITGLWLGNYITKEKR